MSKVLISIAALALLTAYLAISARDLKNPNKKLKIASIISVIVLVTVLLMASFQIGETSNKYTVAYISEQTITLIDDTNGDTVKISAKSVSRDGSLEKGDKVVVVENFWGVPQYIGVVNGDFIPAKVGNK